MLFLYELTDYMTPNYREGYCRSNAAVEVVAQSIVVIRVYFRVIDPGMGALLVFHWTMFLSCTICKINHSLVLHYERT